MIKSNIQKIFREPNINLMKYSEVLARLSILHPRHQNILKNICRFAYIVLWMIFMTLSIYKSLLVYKDLSLLTPVLEGIMILIHTAFKFICLLANQKQFLELLEIRETFWKTSKNYEKFLLRSKYLIIILAATSYMVLGFFSLKIFRGELPITCYIPESFNFYLLVVLQNFLNFYIVHVVCAVDSIWFGSGLELIVQFRLLKDFIRHLDLKKRDSLDKIRIAINYHNLLIHYGSNVSAFLSIAFFGQYAVCVLSTCFEMYAILDSKELDQEAFIRGVVYVSVLSSQIFVYCYIAELLEQEMTNVGQAVAECQWYGNSNLKSQKSLLLVIMQANRVKQFSAGGIIAIKLATFLNIFRTAFSIYTFLKKIK